MASLPTQRILDLALAEGFDLASLAPLTPPPRAEEYGRYLDAGRHADMDWMERGRERIQDPHLTLPAGRSILALGLGFSRPHAAQTPGGRVARYAVGRDYHNLVGKKLKRLTRKLREEGLVSEARWIVDAGPLLERSHAAQAGLGFESKAANLLHPLFGPWFFLAEILIDAEVEGPTSPPVDITCGTCICSDVKEWCDECFLYDLHTNLLILVVEFHTFELLNGTDVCCSTTRDDSLICSGTCSAQCIFNTMLFFLLFYFCSSTHADNCDTSS